MDSACVSCDGVKRLVKQFLDDMLSEGEYQGISVHLDSCGACREYVSSLGAISNQIWRLADIEAPLDFEATVLFKITKQAKQPAVSKQLSLRKFLIAVMLAICAAFTVFFGMGYFKYRALSRQAPAAPAVAPQEPEAANRPQSSYFGPTDVITLTTEVKTKESGQR